MIIVTPETFKATINKLVEAQELSVDTETTGLFPYKKDRLFSIQISDEHEDYYFNFKTYKTGEAVLSFDQIKDLQVLFNLKRIFMQNAKFDMRFLHKEGINFDSCDVNDTEVMARLIRNDHMKYSLDEQAKRDLGESKDDKVMEYITKNKLFTAETIPGKDTVVKALHFDQVPFELIAPYGCKDTRLTLKLGKLHLEKIKALSEGGTQGAKTLWDVHEMEKRLIHTCFKMEKVGIKIDREYCDEAVKFETNRIEKAKTQFFDYTDTELTDSGQCLGPIFEGLGFKPAKTATGEHEITDAFLETVTDPLGKIVQDFREARKRANTYFKSYIYAADSSGAIHADMRQAGTRTGRFSYRDPNLQNIPSDDKDSEIVDDSPYPIRRAFVPREGYLFLSIDYKQMEFRMMLDEAGQTELINKIKEGHDPHDATAELTKLSRKAAKNLNFGLLYGMGIIKLAFSILKMTPEQKRCLKIYEGHQEKKTLGLMNEAEKNVALPIIQEMKEFKQKYFQGLPMVENFIMQCSGAVKIRDQKDPGNGWIKTWFGRRAYFTPHSEYGLMAYKAANAKIQGGCADVVKIAMNRLDDFLLDKKSRMIVQVHDELLFEISFDELELIGGIMQIMETAYQSRSLPLTCSMSYSLKSFYDMIDGDPRDTIGKEKRDNIQRENPPSPKISSEYLGGKNSAAVH